MVSFPVVTELLEALSCRVWIARLGLPLTNMQEHHCRRQVGGWRRNGRVRFAHTGPFHVLVEGRPLRPRKAEVEYLVDRVEKEIARSRGTLPEAAIAEYEKALEAYGWIAKSAR